MMREIKFRGINLESFQFERLVIPMGIFIYGSYSHVHDEKGNPSIIPLNDNRHISVDANTVGQFIGLKDKKDKGIYEGDLIEFQEQIWLVQWFYASLRCVAIDHLNAPSDQWHQTLDFGNMGHQSHFEIIGNVWETPQLLAPTKRPATKSKRRKA